MSNLRSEARKVSKTGVDALNFTFAVDLGMAVVHIQKASGLFVGLQRYPALMLAASFRGQSGPTIACLWKYLGAAFQEISLQHRADRNRVMIFAPWLH